MKHISIKRIALFVFTFLLLGAGSLMAQRTITGTVNDAEENETLIGANIIVKGTAIGTITDFDGTYSIDVPADATTLVFSYTGYTTQEVAIGASDIINVNMSAGELLDEVVVVGYGTVKKRDLTGSVVSLKEDDFNQGIVVSSDQLLQGRVPGVNVVINSGQPGGEATVKIRGNASIRAGANPLYVIDGVPLDGRSARAVSPNTNIGDIPNSNPLNFLNPSDIASITVLKDASSAAIYGSRGANGVILVETKKGRKGEPQFDFSASAGISSILKKYEVLDGPGYAAARESYGLTSLGTANVDAFDAITRSAVTQQYFFSVGGGSENGTYRIGGGYYDQEGIIENTGLKRYSASLNAGYNFLDDRVGLDVLLITSHQTENIAAVATNSGFTGNVVGQALQWNPTIPLLNTDGSFVTGSNNPSSAEIANTTINPLHLLNAQKEVANTTTVLANISPYINITDNLQYRFLYGISHGIGTALTNVTGDLNREGIIGRGFASSSDLLLTSQVHTHTLSYNQDLSEDLSFNALAGYEYQKFDRRGQAVWARGFSNILADNSRSIQNANVSDYNTFSIAEPISELQSYFGRINGSYNGKYLVTATIRADGSSKFGSKNKYGYFPSFALGWNISDEDFVSGGTFDALKLRAGWGQTGNQEFPAGAAQTQFSLLPNNEVEQLNTANSELKWETSTTLNVGLDFALFDYKLSGTVEWYRRSTADLLLDPFVSEPGPSANAWRNIDGNIINKGFELFLNTFIVENENLSFQLGVNASFLSNTFEDFIGAPIEAGQVFGQGSSEATVQRIDNDQPLNTFFTKEFTGLQEEEGPFQGHNTFANDGASVFLGDPNADVVLGVTTNLNVGNLGFVMNFNGAFGHEIYNNTRMSVLPIGNLTGSRNIDASLEVSGDNPESLANAITPSSRFLESGDFLKLSNATLSYNLGDIGSLKNARVSLTGQNLFVITDYSGFDPEVNTVNLRNGVPSSGIEYIPYPSARSIILGVGVSF